MGQYWDSDGDCWSYTSAASFLDQLDSLVLAISVSILERVPHFEPDMSTEVALGKGHYIM